MDQKRSYHTRPFSIYSERSFHLKDNKIPPSFHIILFASFPAEVLIKGTKYVNMGSQIHLVCNASGISRAPEKIDWFFKGNRIHPSNPRWKGRVAILKHTAIPGRSFISELVIKQSTIADQGDYVCRSSDLKVTNLKVHVLNGKYLSRWIFSMSPFYRLIICFLN